MARGKFFTEDEIRSAIDLNAQGVSIATIAYRRGRSRNNLSRAINSYKKGTWAPARLAEKANELQGKIESSLASGVIRPVDIANSIGASQTAVGKALWRMGLDDEMRREAANV